MKVSVSELGKTQEVSIQESGDVFPSIVDDGLEKLARALINMEVDGIAHVGRFGEVFNTSLISPQGSCGTNIHAARVDALSEEELQGQYLEVFKYLKDYRKTTERQQLMSR